MRINSSASKSSGLPTSGVTSSSNASARDANAVERNIIASSEYLPSEELAQIVGLASQEPEVRPSVLRQAADRLASGYYLTEESAVLTAQAIRTARD